MPDANGIVISLSNYSQNSVGNKFVLGRALSYISSLKNPMRGIFSEGHCPAESERGRWGQLESLRPGLVA